MEFMQLKMFVAVVEEGSINKAADKVFRTQPAISIALRKLEDEIGSRLIDRSQRGDYQLTPAGELLYSYATRLINLCNETVSALNDLSHLRRGLVRVGANESTSVYLLPGVTRAFHEQYPEVKIEVTCKHSGQLLVDLYERRLDLALLAHFPQEHELDARLIMHDELVLIVSPNHRLAGVSEVHLPELAAESIVTEGASSSLHEQIVNIFCRYQTKLNVDVESGNIETIKKMVATGVGVAIVPLMCVQEEVEAGTLIVVPCVGLRYERSLWAVRRCSDVHSDAALAFMKMVTSLADGAESVLYRELHAQSAEVVDFKVRTA